MKYRIPMILLLAALLLTGCSQNPGTPTETEPANSSETASETSAETVTESASETEPQTEPASETVHETAPQQTVGFAGMEPVTADVLHDGTYSIAVDSSSSMFKVTACELTVADGKLTARINTGSTSYDAMFLGTEAEAAAAAETIPFEEIDGERWFTLPVEALNQEITCASLSKKKQEWYGRTLVFRADSLPEDAYAVKNYQTAQELGIADGSYTIEVTLEGGSGRASVQSPAKLTVENGEATAEIIWSSNKYDYMLVGGEKYLPVSTDEFSVFEIPVTGFNYAMPVKADTTAMSTPYEIEYTLYFDASSVQ